MKALGWIIALVVLVIVGVGVYVVMNSGALLERAIERYGTAYLGAPVSVSSVDVAVTEGTAGINGLVVANPAGFSGPPAFRLGNISTTLDTGQISSELVVLKNVSIDAAEVNLLARGKDTNLKALMDHLNAEIGATDQAEETGVESQVRLIIDRFSFTNAKASVSSDVLGDATVDIPDIQLSDIGRQSNGATVGEVLEQVLTPIYRAVTREMVEQGIDLEGAREELEQNLREKAGDELQQGLENLTNKLRGNE